MRSKLSNLGAFRTGVMKSLHPGRSRFFGLDIDMHQPLLSSQEKDEGVQNLYDSLPTGDDVIYRGTIGRKEIEHAMKTNRLGMDFKDSKKEASLDIVAFIRENNSKYLLSFSPCSQTVKPYASGLSIVPCKGFIWVTGLPQIYTLPQKLLHLNSKMFKKYDEEQSKRGDQDDPREYQSIITMTKNNNEITAVIGTSDGDWRPDVTKDVMKLIQVAGPGHILGKFMSSNEVVHVKDWTNPGFQRRLWSIEVVLGRYARTIDNFEEMNENAREMQLISADSRLITLEDAQAVVNSGRLDELNDIFEIAVTHRLTKVPKGIAIGDVDALVEYMIAEITSQPTLIAIDSAKRPVIE